jgi:peptide/nickel transport system substrate-binding protein
MKKLLLVLVGFTLVISLLLGACKSTESTSTTKPATTTSPITTTPKPLTTTPTTTAPSTTTSAPTGDKYGGTWREALTAAPSRPIGYPSEAAPDSYTDSSPAVENLLGAQLDGTIKPLLATSWKVADDGSSITLSLRKGVKFHDGSDFNSDVCKWNLDLKISAKMGNASGWKSIDKVDDYTIRINLTSYQNTALTNLSSGITQIVSKAYIDKNGVDAARWHPVGTGPFIFLSYEVGSKITYTRNPNYWDTGKPYLDGVIMNVIADATVRKLAFQKGDFERLSVAGGLDAVQLQQAGYPMKTVPGGTYVLVPDSAVAGQPWTNVNVRLAASYSLDRVALSKGLGLGFLNPAYQLFPGYADTKIPNLQVTEFNQAKAKDLLTQAGFPSGFKTIIHAFTRIVPADYITAVAGQLRTVGIDVTTDFPESGAYDNLRYSGWKDGMLGHALANYTNHNQEWSSYFAPTIFPSMKRPNGWQEAVNASLASPQIDPKLMQTVIQLMYDDMTVIPYCEQVQISFYRKGVNDPDADTNWQMWPIFQDCWIDKSAR